MTGIRFDGEWHDVLPGSLRPYTFDEEPCWMFNAHDGTYVVRWDRVGALRFPPK